MACGTVKTQLEKAEGGKPPDGGAMGLSSLMLVPRYGKHNVRGEESGVKLVRGDITVLRKLGNSINNGCRQCPLPGPLRQPRETVQ